jgi:D-alanyl-D-alanine carboxypeptidase
MKQLILTIALAASFVGTSAHAEAPQPVLEAVNKRALEAGFEGAILIGEDDGSYNVMTTGVEPVPANAVWRWASITKQLAAVLAMQEVAAGRLDLDTPVSRFWPEWASPNAATVRVRDLMLHNSGLPQPDESPADKDGVPAFYRTAAATPSASAAGYCAGPVRAAAPARFEYNNCDTIVLAEVLARVTGKPFEKLVQERIARKLRLKSFGIYGLGARPASHVKPIGEAAEVDPLINLGVNGASAGAFGTIADLWKFDRALLDGTLLAEKEREIMWTSSRENGFHGFFQWIYPAPLAGCEKPVRIVERQGLVGGIELRNYLMPEFGRTLIMFSRKRPTGLGDPWEGKGFAFDLLSAAICRSAK